MITTRHAVIALCLAVAGTEVRVAQTTPVPQQTPATRRSQRLMMPPLEVSSPNGQITFKLLPNAERLTFAVTLGQTSALDPRLSS